MIQLLVDLLTELVKLLFQVVKLLLQVSRKRNSSGGSGNGVVDGKDDV